MQRGIFMERNQETSNGITNRKSRATQQTGETKNSLKRLSQSRLVFEFPLISGFCAPHQLIIQFDSPWFNPLRRLLRALVKHHGFNPNYSLEHRTVASTFFCCCYYGFFKKHSLYFSQINQSLQFLQLDSPQSHTHIVANELLWALPMLFKWNDEHWWAFLKTYTIWY